MYVNARQIGTLRLVTPYLSITKLDEVILPSLCVITGVNGAGKTHLLRSIESGSVEYVGVPHTSARFLDWTSLVPAAAGNANLLVQQQLLDKMAARTSELRKNHEHELTQKLRTLGINDDITDVWDLVRREPNDLPITSGDRAAVSQLLREHASTVSATLTRKGDGSHYFAAVAAALGGWAPILVDESSLKKHPPPAGVSDIFQQSFADVFLAYHKIDFENRMTRFEHNENTSLPTGLSDEEFIAKHGRAPWLFVNEAMDVAGLDFVIDSPPRTRVAAYSPRLSKRSTGQVVEFASLSSGEKILMSFAFCLYHLTDRRSLARPPQLLLLDEVDAPLHPSMSRRLLAIIEKSVVQDARVRVVLATHSPATVAVAPPKSVFLMEPGARLHQIPRERAISVLTADIPTLSIDISGRRQVFVESGYDVERYEALYKAMAPKMNSERSLQFIPAGASSGRPGDGEGCTRVIAVTNALVAAGNTSVFGLVDWDAKNKQAERLIVLAESRRYAIENHILDPLPLLLLLLQRGDDAQKVLGLSQDLRYGELPVRATETLQPMLNEVQKKVLGAAIGETVPCEYLGGMSYAISRAYLEMQGHKLEEQAKDAFSSLRQFHQPNKLAMTIIKYIMRDKPDVIPIELHQAFSAMLA